VVDVRDDAEVSYALGGDEVELAQNPVLALERGREGGRERRERKRERRERGLRGRGGGGGGGAEGRAERGEERWGEREEVRRVCRGEGAERKPQRRR